MKKVLISILVVALVAASVFFTIKIINSKSNKNAEINNPEETTTELVTTEAPTVTEELEATPMDTTEEVVENKIDFNDPAFPRSHILDLELINQFPELPAGCESVSLTMILNYYGYNLDKTYIAENHLVYSDNFVLGYMGNPFSSTIGGGCYAPGMVDTANSFLKKEGSTYRAKNITGAEFEDLLEYVAGGTPVMVWTTINMSDPDKGFIQYDNLGNAYAWENFEHCVVLGGYDLDKNLVTIYDPMEGVMERDLERFKYTFESMYHMAIILKEY